MRRQSSSSVHDPFLIADSPSLSDKLLIAPTLIVSIYTSLAFLLFWLWKNILGGSVVIERVIYI